jgi:hypothetical protein
LPVLVERVVHPRGACGGWLLRLSEPLVSLFSCSASIGQWCKRAGGPERRHVIPAGPGARGSRLHRPAHLEKAPASMALGSRLLHRVTIAVVFLMLPLSQPAWNAVGLSRFASSP